jgi:hypothetical protein
MSTRLAHLLELFGEDSQLNVYAGELEVRPPGAPTMDRMGDRPPEQPADPRGNEPIRLQPDDKIRWSVLGARACVWKGEDSCGPRHSPAARVKRTDSKPFRSIRERARAP